MEYLFIINLIIPITCVIIGSAMYDNPPKKINDDVGFRLERAKKSKFAWDFTQKMGSKTLVKFGLLSVLPAIVFINFGWLVSLLFVLTDAALLRRVYKRKELELKDIFDEKGNVKLTPVTENPIKEDKENSINDLKRVKEIIMVLASNPSNYEEIGNILNELEEPNINACFNMMASNEIKARVKELNDLYQESTFNRPKTLKLKK